MIDIFLHPNSYPFSISLAIVTGLFILEIISLLLGGSLMAIGSDGPEIDLDAEADFDLSIETDTDVIPDADTDIALAPSSLLGWLGIKQVPFMVWMISFLTIFGLSGMILQSISFAVLSYFIPSAIASLLVMVPTLATVRTISEIVAAIMPKTESSAMSKRFLGGHHGVITQGTAMRGKPAEAKIKDRHGNLHYLRVEPLDDAETLSKGCDIHIIRKKDGMFFAVDIS